MGTPQLLLEQSSAFTFIETLFYEDDSKIDNRNSKKP
jgi:hypothetical protein